VAVPLKIQGRGDGGTDAVLLTTIYKIIGEDSEVEGDGVALPVDLGPSPLRDDASIWRQQGNEQWSRR